MLSQAHWSWWQQLHVSCLSPECCPDAGSRGPPGRHFSNPFVHSSICLSLTHGPATQPVHLMEACGVQTQCRPRVTQKGAKCLSPGAHGPVG